MQLQWCIPMPIKAFDCIVLITMPSSFEIRSIISNPTYCCNIIIKLVNFHIPKQATSCLCSESTIMRTLCLVPWYLFPGFPSPTTSHGVYSTLTPSLPVELAVTLRTMGAWSFWKTVLRWKGMHAPGTVSACSISVNYLQGRTALHLSARSRHDQVNHNAHMHVKQRNRHTLIRKEQACWSEDQVKSLGRIDRHSILCYSR